MRRAASSYGEGGISIKPSDMLNAGSGAAAATTGDAAPATICYTYLVYKEWKY